MDEDRLSDDELKLLASLLKRYCSTDLDQFEHWRVGTPFGEVFIELSRRPQMERTHYVPIDQPS